MMIIKFDYNLILFFITMELFYIGIFLSFIDLSFITSGIPIIIYNYKSWSLLLYIYIIIAITILLSIFRFIHLSKKLYTYYQNKNINIIINKNKNININQEIYASNYFIYLLSIIAETLIVFPTYLSTYDYKHTHTQYLHYYSLWIYFTIKFIQSSIIMVIIIVSIIYATIYHIYYHTCHKTNNSITNI
jgi:hypothetical protein